MKLEIPIEFPEPKAFWVLDDQTRTLTEPALVPAGTGPLFAPASSLPALATLPPLLLDVLLPATYPYSPPVLQSLHATHSWLPLCVKLQRMLLEMWQDGQGVLYNWIETIRSGEFLDSLGLVCVVNGEETVRYATMPLLERNYRLTCAQDITPGASRVATCAQGVRPVYPADKVLTNILRMPDMPYVDQRSPMYLAILLACVLPCLPRGFLETLYHRRQHCSCMLPGSPLRQSWSRGERRGNQASCYGRRGPALEVAARKARVRERPVVWLHL